LEDRTTPASAAYVTALYSDLLHRSPQPAEVTQVSAQLDGGTPASAIVAGIVNSAEYQGHFVQSCYQLFLNRQPTSAEVSGWLPALQAGLSGPQCEATFLASSEFMQAHQGSSSWINALYEQVLGRPADPTGLAGDTQALQNGRSNLAVALDVVNSPEAHARVIGDAYRLLLGRSAAPAEVAGWQAVANQSQGPDLVLVSIASSPECAAHADGATGAAAPTAPGTGPFFSEPFCADPFQFSNPGGPLGGSGGGSGSG
jgi:hypothetical protein